MAKVPGSKNYWIRRRLPRGQLLAISARTHRKTEYEHRNGLITKLLQGGHHDTLGLLKQGTLTILDVVDADRQGKLEHLAKSVLTYKPFLPAFDDWVATHNCAAKTRKDYKEVVHRVAKAADLDETAAITALRTVPWPVVRAKFSEYDWNHFRGALSSFLNHTHNRALKSFRTEIFDMLPGVKLPVNKQTFSIDQFWKVVAHVDPRWQAVFVAMALLSVGPGEFAKITPEDLDESRHLVRVHGTKNVYRDREVRVGAKLWGWIERAFPAPRGMFQLRKYWNTACKKAGVGRMRLYDLRHLSAQSASEAGATVQQIATHLGHSQLSTTMWYLKGPMAEAVAKGIEEEFLNSPGALPATPALDPGPTVRSDDPA